MQATPGKYRARLPGPGTIRFHTLFAMKTFQDFRAVYRLSLPELILRAAEVHRGHRGHGDIQRCELLSIKTGGCPEDCKYCSQSAHYDTPVDRQPLITVAEVRERAGAAKERGASRFCMGAAWREPKDGPEFDRVLDMVRVVRELGMEVIEAGNGREGLEQLRRPPGVELVLVDWNMPEMDGLEFITAVRAERAFDPVRIMMVTTETEQEQVLRALNAGANEYLMKPFSRAMVALVRRLGLKGR